MNLKKKTIRGHLKKITKPLLILEILAGIIYWVNFRPTPVEEYQVKRNDITSVIMGTGTFDAKVKMILSSKISGRIKSILVDQGDRVKKINY